jgi:hypothetical protein
MSGLRDGWMNGLLDGGMERATTLPIHRFRAYGSTEAMRLRFCLGIHSSNIPTIQASTNSLIH